MGCDIHFKVERRRPDGNWERAEPLRPLLPFDDPDDSLYALVQGKRRVVLYSNRMYATFAVLADVRNRGDIVPISLPRGLPPDVSEETKGEYDAWEGQSAPWLTLKELAAYDWLQLIEPGLDQFGTHRDLDPEIVSVIKTMCEYGSANDVRAVFWFDS